MVTLFKYILILIFLVFAALFFVEKQYVLVFFSLVLLLISSRADDLLELWIGNGNIKAFFKSNSSKHLSKIIHSKKSPDEKVKLSQKLVDDAFYAGYAVATGGTKIIGKVNNVKILKDRRGHIIYQYDEI
jgi:hypothetical protein